MQKWMRWQGLVALVAGVYAALAPIWTETETAATWTMVVLGVVTAAAALWSLARAEDRIAGPVLALTGVLLIVSPWVMGFDELSNMTMTAVIIGAVTAVAGVLAMPQVEHRFHLGHRPITH